MSNMMLSNVLNVFKKIVLCQILFLLLMSLHRLIFFIYYSPLKEYSNYYLNIINAFILGFRIDLTVIGYIQIIPTLLLIFIYYLKRESILLFFSSFFKYYLLLCYILVTLFFCADFGFYSYFKSHINILFFGLLDDDKKALMITMWQNYNVVLILSLFFVYIYILFTVVKITFNKNSKYINSLFGIKISFFVFLFILVLNFMAVRGTFGMYPLGSMIPNVSTNEFINKLSHNGVRSFASAYKIRKKYMKRKYDLIEATGFKNNIKKAFQIVKASSEIDENNLLNNITYKTRKVDDKEYNVIVIMVESFGMPILKYNSEEFNILGSLKKHFNEDILMKNFISSGDGTIPSLESLLLNIPYRPNSFPLAQSTYKQTPFEFTPAFLYKDAGYETSFIYGGDLSWRSIGDFVKYQAYDNAEGKIDIYNSVKSKNKDESEYFHPWGIFDEHLYDFILNKLQKSTQKQFIFALSTNNHPPYNVPNDYQKKSLVFSKNIKNHITGDLDLAKQRFYSYQYAVDSVGKFLDKFKQSKFAQNTIIAVTADNNTIDGIMKYDDNKLLNSKNIPLYLYLPKELKKKQNINVKVEGSHKDIFPTLYNMTLNQTKYISVGQDLFDKKQQHYGFNGSLIVSGNSKIEIIKDLRSQTKSENANYYKANLAITQYLIEEYYKKANK